MGKKTTQCILENGMPVSFPEMVCGFLRSTTCSLNTLEKSQEVFTFV
jgi:hypothetical protein